MMHWLTAGLMLLVFALAFSIDLATSRASHTAFLQLHRSVGLSVWLLTMVRLAWRHFAKYPDWPSGKSLIMRVAAMASEYALYALLLTQPILGFLQTSANGDHVYLFFIGQLPSLIEKNRPLAQQLLIVHKSVGFTLLGLIAVHVSAALSHHFLRRDDTLTAMLPAASRPRRVRSWADQPREADVPRFVPSGNSSVSNSGHSSN
jgi:cytochrome b561